MNDFNKHICMKLFCVFLSRIFFAVSKVMSEVIKKVEFNDKRAILPLTG